MKHKKSALFKSVISLLLCISMLIGTTFAWFTDTETSGINAITAGNLDVALYHSNAAVTNKKVDSNTKLFLDLKGKPIKWEPGAVSYENLRVSNNGDLALSYQLSINTANENFILDASGSMYGLSQALKVGVVKGGITATDRLSAVAAVDAGSWTTLANFLRGGKLLPRSAGTSEEIWGVVIYWEPSDDDNNWNLNNGKTLSAGTELNIDLGVRLVATQEQHESDSFGNSYDSTAKENVFPNFVGGSVSVDVQTNAQNQTVSEVVMTIGKVKAIIPAGVQLAAGKTALTLSVSEMSVTGSNIQLSENEIMRSLDVHIEGVADSNTMPITVTLTEVAPTGLNMGNYKLYHVEKDGTKEMSLVDSSAAFTAHNQFKYDPATGDIVLHMATFSEVAVVAEEAKWEGGVDHSWYIDKQSPYIIANADQLWSFSQIVGGMAKDKDGNFLITYKDSDGDEHHNDTFSGKIVKLISNINLGDDEKNNVEDKIFYPIGYWNNEGTYEKSGKAVSSGFYAFKGTFDGNGNTISNFYQNTWEMKGDHDWYDATLQYFRDGMGLFGKVYGGTVKNLTVDNFSSDGEIATTGVIAAYADSENGKPAVFENISITNCNPRVYNIGNGGIVGCAGWYSRNNSLGNEEYTNAVTFRNITVDQTNKISALWGSWGVSCAGILGQYYPNSNCGIKLENCHVAAVIDVNNDVCSNYQYYWYRYCGMFIGTIRANTKDSNGYTIADTTGVFAQNCTYTMGDWNEYWYCELVVNTLASYTHDHQFSRLTKISALSEIQDENGNWNKEGHYVIPNADNTDATCYHIMKNSKGELYQHFHDVADESNPNIYETFDLDGNGKLDDLKEDRQRYFIPFNQLLTGLDMGIKAHLEFPGIEHKEDGTVKSEVKFTATNVTAVPKDSVISVGDLFRASGNGTISSPTVQVYVSPVGEDSTAGATYSADVADWYKGTLTFSGEGAARVVITDFFYCKSTAITISVGGEANVEKFVANDGVTAVVGTSLTVGQIFGAKDGAYIDSSKVSVAISGVEYEYTANTADWTQGTIIFKSTGDASVSISENALCIPCVNTISIGETDSFTTVFEHTDKYLYRVGNKNSIDLDLLFKQLDTANINSDVIVTVVNTMNGTTVMEKTFGKDVWLNQSIDFEDTFTAPVQVTVDALGANAYTLNLEVVDAKNYPSPDQGAALAATDNNVVLLADTGSSGFTVSNGHTFYGNGFKVTCSGKGTYLNVGGMYRGYINVESGGVLDNIEVQCDIYPVALLYSTEAKNYRDPDLSTDTSTRNMYQLSAIAIKDNGSQILNSYVYGGRNNIYVGDGNVMISNTTMKNGVLSNIHIKGTNASTTTLIDVTTIQQRVSSTYQLNGETTTMLGCGVLVGDKDSTSNPNLIIKGAWNHYNWVTADDAANISSDYAKSIINTAVATTAYQHVNEAGNTTVNLGAIILNGLAINIDDQRTVKSNYLLSPVTMKIKDPSTGLSGDVSGQVYSLGSNKGNPDSIVPDYTSNTSQAAKPSKTLDQTVGGNYDPNDGGSDTRCCYWDGEVLTLMYKESAGAFALDIANLVSFQKHGHTLDSVAVVTRNGQEIAAVDGKVTFAEAGSYVIAYTVTDPYNYDKDGNQSAEAVKWVFTFNVEVSVVKNAGKNAEINVTSNAFYGNYGKTSSLLDPDYHYCIPFMEDVIITDYAEDGVTASTFDAASNLINISVTGDKTSGTVTLTYLDGRKLVVTVSGHSVGLGSTGNTISVKSYSSQLWICTDGTSNNVTTGTWTVTSYTFTGNNGVPVSYSTARTCNFDSSSTGNSPQPGWSSYSSPSVASIQYTVTYNANGGSCTKTESYTTASSTTVTLPTPSRSGYIFAGWYTAASGGTRVGGGGDSYTPSANITLFAQWGLPCTVTYNANGGSCDTTSAKYTGTALTLPTATRDGYWFIGWYDAASGGNKIGDAGSTYNPLSEITLYAHWQEQVKYTVTYNNDGSTTSATYEGAALTLPSHTKTGYTFSGWYTAASGGTRVGGGGDSYTPSANITLYAQWQVNSYTVTISTSNATVSGVTNGQSVAYGTSVSVTVSFSQSSSKTFTVTDASGNTILSKSAAGTYSFTMPASNVTINASSSSGCVTGDTLVTLANGTQKRIDQVNHNDLLLAWDFYKGEKTYMPASLIFNHGYADNTVIELIFEDGTTVKAVNYHQFFDADLNRFVNITGETGNNYIGHRFVKETGESVKLVDCNVTQEYIVAYGALTAYHYNIYTNGILSADFAPEGLDLFTYFDVGDNMKYDEEKVQADINRYGLYSYSEFKDYLTYEQFDAFNIKYMKITVGKGHCTFERILEVINTYVNN